MRLYAIRYRTEDDLGCPVFTQRVRAHDPEDARQRFIDDPDGDGWEILSVTFVREVAR